MPELKPAKPFGVGNRLDREKGGRGNKKTAAVEEESCGRSEGIHRGKGRKDPER